MHFLVTVLFHHSLRNQQGPFPACHWDIEALSLSRIVPSVSAPPLVCLPLSVLFPKMNVSSRTLDIAWPWHIFFHASNYANLITLNSIPSPWNPIIPQSQMFPLCFIFTCNFDWSLPSLNACSIHADSAVCKFMILSWFCYLLYLDYKCFNAQTYLRDVFLVVSGIVQTQQQTRWVHALSKPRITRFHISSS